VNATHPAGHRPGGGEDGATAAPPVRAAMHTDLGRLRTRNEDACLVDADFGLFAVADGMGGHPAGDVAARLAIEHLPGLVRQELAGVDRDTAGVGGAGEDAAAALERAVLALNEVVIAAAAATPGRQGMGTTLVLALVSGHTALVAHAGDSRAYLLHGDRLHRLTEDHSLAAALVDGGVLDAEQAARHPFAQSLTQAIGLPGTRPEVHGIRLAAGDRLLLCSDGLTKMLAEQQIADLLAAGRDTGATSRSLVQAANDAGGHDNISVVLVDVLDAHSG
jgi:PPM family protein phosphatase